MTGWITNKATPTAGRAAEAAKRACMAAHLILTAAMTSAQFGMTAYATSVFGNVTVNSENLSKNFSDPNAVMSMVVGLALWVCQIVGVGMLIWGIYGYVTARKDGEPEAMNGALGKLVAGAVLIGMKGILAALGIVS